MKNKKGIATIYIVIFIILLVVFVGYAFWNNYQNTQKNKLLNSNPNEVIKSATTSTPVPINIKITSTTYPNKNITPGNILTMDATFLCIPGTPEKLHKDSIPESVVKQVFANYHITYPTTKAYQIDKYIPYSLGGSDNIKNLWPQGETPAPGYKEKDIAEKYLYDLMCNKTINITTAQERIKTDWVKVYQEAITKK
jgi:hypothetical protein